MSSVPYRVSSWYAVSSTTGRPDSIPAVETPRSLTEIPGVEFIAMPRFEGVQCVDMYGDLPYGLFVLPNGVVRGGAAYIFTKEGVPIVEQNADFLRKGKFLRPRFEDVSVVEVDPVELNELISLKARCHTGFFHWMLGALPKVFLAESAGYHGSYLLPPRSLAPWAPESMSLLKISDDRLVFEDDREISSRRLCVPTYFSGYNAHHNIAFMRPYREWVRSAVAETVTQERQRIFIARRLSAGVRRVVNQEQVEGVLSEFGFDTVYFEDLPVRRQLEIACSADAMVAPHGAGLSHSLFMDDNSLLIELFPHKRQQSCDCFEMLATVPLHRYCALEGQAPCEGDIDVNLEELRHVLARLLPQSARGA